ncbi:MAG: hypothetical protein U5L04_12585 [Trueperaceae bacterium]|nr:hypothetical protein [Trueperaceae bacterium]
MDDPLAQIEADLRTVESRLSALHDHHPGQAQATAKMVVTLRRVLRKAIDQHDEQALDLVLERIERLEQETAAFGPLTDDTPESSAS